MDLKETKPQAKRKTTALSTKLVKLYTCIVLGFISYNSFAQHNTVVTLDVGKPSSCALIIGDTSNCKKTIKHKIPHNRTIQFFIKNANPLKFKYEFNSKFVNLFNDNTDKFKTSLTSTFESTDIKMKITLKEEERAMKNIIPSNHLIDIENVILRKYQNDSLAKHYSEIIQLQENLTHALSSKESSQKNNLNVIKQMIDLRQEKLKNIALQIIETHAEQFESLGADVDLYLKKNKSEDYLNKNTFVTQRDLFYNAATSITKSLNKEIKKIESLLSDSDAELCNRELEKTYKPIKTEIEKLINTMFMLKLDNYDSPIKFSCKNIDALTLTLKRTTKDGNSTSNEKSYDFWVKGGFKIDISAGVFLSTIRDRSYTINDLIDAEGNTIQVINETDLGDLDYGFGSLANISYRTGGWIKPTLNFGFMLTNNQKFQFLAGGGLILGKMSRFAFHYGVSIGRASSIQNPYVADGITAVENLTSETIPTVEKLQIGQFFGVTYNLGKVRTQEDK